MSQELVDVVYKACTKCEELKPATPEFFHRDKRRVYGLRPECIVCSNERKRKSKTATATDASGRRRGLPRPRRLRGTPEQCGACGTTTGNILGDVDQQCQYGYLCFRCHKMVSDFRADSARMQKVVVYLKKTRG